MIANFKYQIMNGNSEKQETFHLKSTEKMYDVSKFYYYWVKAVNKMTTNSEKIRFDL